jgi:hypothetical protein
VIGETVFEWTRPRPDRKVETITVLARASASGAAAMAVVAATVYREVSAEVDLRIEDPVTRFAIKKAYLERLVRSDLGGPVDKALDRRDPAMGEYFEALGAFLESIPAPILESSDLLVRRLLWPPLRRWRSLVPGARSAYRRMVRARIEADTTTGYRAGGPFRFPALAVARLFGPHVGRAAASALVESVAIAKSVLARRRGS